MLRDETLARDACEADERLTGQYVIVMECADCDLGSDISHGHYAGRDKKRVRTFYSHEYHTLQPTTFGLKIYRGDVKKWSRE